MASRRRRRLSRGIVAKMVTSLGLVAMVAGPVYARGESAAQRGTPAIVGHSYIRYPGSSAREPFRIRVGPDLSPGDVFREDWLVMEVLNDEADSEVMTRRRFHSTYGAFRLTLADLTGDGLEEFILVTGEGRGTSVRRKMLTVEMRKGQDFVAILALPVSGWFSFSPPPMQAGLGHWWYDIDVKDLDGNGTPDLRLTLDNTPEVTQQNSPEKLPGFAVIEYVWSEKGQEMALYRQELRK